MSAKSRSPSPGLQVNLVPVAEAVGQPDFVNPREIERIDKPGDALGHEMRVVGGERQAERR